MSDKVDIAVRRLQEAAEMSQMLYEKPRTSTPGGRTPGTTDEDMARLDAALEGSKDESK